VNFNTASNVISLGCVNFNGGDRLIASTVGTVGAAHRICTNSTTLQKLLMSDMLLNPFFGGVR